MADPAAISFILPARNEAVALKDFLPRLKARFGVHEIIVVDDGSTDDTVAVCQDCGVKVVSHPYSKGNGAALKTGARFASGEVLLFADADGQHTIEAIEAILDTYKRGTNVDMVVGARSRSGQASYLRALGNWTYNRLASYIVQHRVEDLTSGCRAVNAELYKQFLHLLPNGFSAPSTITLAFFRSGFSVQYVPISVEKRVGHSHLNPIKDGIRFFIILYKLTILYSPLKVFLPLSLLHVIIGGVVWALSKNALMVIPNISVFFWIAAIIIFLIGLVSEQITVLLYQPRRDP